jgi:hypothetical protein
VSPRWVIHGVRKGWAGIQGTQNIAPKITQNNSPNHTQNEFSLALTITRHNAEHF